MDSGKESRDSFLSPGQTSHIGFVNFVNFFTDETRKPHREAVTGRLLGLFAGVLSTMVKAAWAVTSWGFVSFVNGLGVLCFFCRNLWKVQHPKSIDKTDKTPLSKTPSQFYTVDKTPQFLLEKTSLLQPCLTPRFCQFRN